jgi:hypothetical protein
MERTWSLVPLGTVVILRPFWLAVARMLRLVVVVYHAGKAPWSTAQEDDTDKSKRAPVKMSFAVSTFTYSFITGTKLQKKRKRMKVLSFFLLSLPAKRSKIYGYTTN